MLSTLRTELPRPLTPIAEGVTDLRCYHIITEGLHGIYLKGQ